MKLKKLYDTTGHRSVLNKAYKLIVSRNEGFCERCPYHRCENAFRKRNDLKNWKRYRKSQWRL